MTPVALPTFEQRLTEICGSRDSALCAGIDPSPESVALILGQRIGDTRAARAQAMERFALNIIEAICDRAVAIKPQMAWFETAGADGMAALERCVNAARDVGLIVVLDGKRGDIPHSASAYADAYLGSEASSGIRADALTANAAIGSDALSAMTEIAHRRACQIYALVHTSNPGSLALQRAKLADSREWWHLLAEMVEAARAGAVIGATHPELLATVRNYLPTAPLLVPGIGAQGGSTDTLIALATATSAPTLVPVSRSLLPQSPCSEDEFKRIVSDHCDELAAQSSIVVVKQRVVSGTIAE